MKTLFTSEAVSKGGRSGTISNPDGLLNITLGNPLEPGKETAGPNPELLFAAAYAACYHGALVNAAERLEIPVQDTTVRVLVGLEEDDMGRFNLAVAVHAKIPDVDTAEGHRIMEAAHQTCPYSRALRGEAPVTLALDS